jgi:phospholipid/cholesterol/gamma-HCH transport system substrate-binding protein
MRRAVVIGLAAIALAVVAGVHFLGGHPFVIHAEFANASGLRKDFYVKIGGVKVGHISRVDLSKRDTALVTMEVQRSALPIGRDATAQIRPSSLLGEYFVQIDPGSLNEPMRSGATIPERRTTEATSFDQVLSAFDASTQAALGVFLGEYGNSLIGRGQDIGDAIKLLPHTLSGARQLVSNLAADNHALGRLIDASDAVLRPVASQRRHLGQLVATSQQVLSAMAQERGPLGRLLSDASPALRLIRGNLHQVGLASQALRRSAAGIRDASEPLRANLEGLPPFVDAVVPLLTEVRRSAPALQRLGEQATPIVRRLVPTSRKYAAFASQLLPAAKVLDPFTANLIGYDEGRGRATIEEDLLGHIYTPSLSSASPNDAARLAQYLLKP